MSMLGGTDGGGVVGRVLAIVKELVLVTAGTAA